MTPLMFFVYLVVENNIYILPMDVVDNNDFLNVSMYLVPYGTMTS